MGPAQTLVVATTVLLALAPLVAAAVLSARDARRRRADPRRQAALARRDRRALAVLGGVIGAMILAGLVLSPRRAEPSTPALPAAPAGASQTVARAADGSRVILQHRGRWLWGRVEAAETSRCRSGSGMRPAYVQGTPRWSGGGGHFVMAGTYGTTTEVDYTVRGMPFPVSVPDTVTYRLVGDFLDDGSARGTFERHDVVRDGDRVVIDCTRSFSWSAPA